MTINYFPDLIQGTDEWAEARRGLLTASEMKLIITPTLKTASNEKQRTHLYELLAQRITGYVEPGYFGDDMARGVVDEPKARELYHQRYAPVQPMGFVTNDQWGFTLGCSPDGLVGDDGMIECKSRKQKYQIETIANWKMPSDYMIQTQTAMLVCGRKWCDFISYSGGLPAMKLRVYPDAEIQHAIIQAAYSFENEIAKVLCSYNTNLGTHQESLTPTVRAIEQEMYV